MTIRCTACLHPRRAALDAALTAGLSVRIVAGRFSLSRSAVERHAQKHLPFRLLRCHERRSLEKPDELYEEVRALHSHTLEVLRSLQLSLPPPPAEKQEATPEAPPDQAAPPAAGRAADPRLLFAAVREVRRNLELCARLQGQLPPAEPDGEQDGASDLDLFVTAVAEALKPFPEAGRAVAARLLTVQRRPAA